MWVKPVNPGILESYSFIIQPCRWKVPLCRWKVHLKPGLPGGTQKSRDVFFPRKHPKAWCINLHRSPKLCKMVIDGQLTLSTSASSHPISWQKKGELWLVALLLLPLSRDLVEKAINCCEIKTFQQKNTAVPGCAGYSHLSWLPWGMVMNTRALTRITHQAAPLTPPKSPSSLAQSPDPWNLLAEMWI